MALLIDDAIWPWQGRLWAHLTSDESVEELHHFAQGLGLRRIGFQGDHYDVDEVDRQRAIAAGAEMVSARDLVRRLVGAGLRDRRAKPHWEPMAESAPGQSVDVIIASISGMSSLRASDRAAISSWLVRVGPMATNGWVRALQRPGLLALLIDHSSEFVEIRRLPEGITVVTGGPRVNGERSLEVFVEVLV